MNRPNTINLAPKTLTPPVSKNKPVDAFASTLHDSRALQPALFLRGNKVLRPSTEPSACLALELKTPRLNDIHQHLWLAGLPAAARPLHRQRLLGRTILVTEDPDEHLVWFETDIFIKPLPEFLFDWDFWHDRLCLDEELHKAACGLLLSYAWLVQHKSDLEVAKELGLLSRSIEWAKWVHFMDAFLDNVDCETMTNVNKRYRYGELRLSRLNAIYRFAPPRYSVRNLVRGYQSGSSWYKAFFERHFKWMLAVFAVLSVVLSALQVGLATVMLQGNGPFQSASYGFTVFSLVAMVASVLVVSSVWVGLFCYYLLVTWRNDREVNRKRVVSASSL